MLRRARKTPLKRFFSLLGPGLTTGAVYNGSVRHCDLFDRCISLALGCREL